MVVVGIGVVPNTAARGHRRQRRRVRRLLRRRRHRGGGRLRAGCGATTRSRSPSASSTGRWPFNAGLQAAQPTAGRTDALVPTDSLVSVGPVRHPLPSVLEPGGDDEVEITEGSLEEGKFVASTDAGRLRAVMAIGRPLSAHGFRPLLQNGVSWDDALRTRRPAWSFGSGVERQHRVQKDNPRARDRRLSLGLCRSQRARGSQRARRGVRMQVPPCDAARTLPRARRWTSAHADGQPGQQPCPGSVASRTGESSIGRPVASASASMTVVGHSAVDARRGDRVAAVGLGRLHQVGAPVGHTLEHGPDYLGTPEPRVSPTSVPRAPKSHTGVPRPRRAGTNQTSSVVSHCRPRPPIRRTTRSASALSRSHSTQLPADNMTARFPRPPALQGHDLERSAAALRAWAMT